MFKRGFMVNKQLSDWIKSEEAQGYSEQQVRQYLTQQGYKQKDIEDAVDLLKPKKGFSFKEFFRPTILKLFFPVLILVIAIIFFYSNYISLPDYGEKLCDIYNVGEEIKQTSSDLIYEKDVDPAKVLDIYKQRYELTVEYQQKNSDLKREVLTHLTFVNAYFLVPRFNWINPIIPIPCESVNTLSSQLVSINPNSRCFNFVSKKSYDCTSKVFGSSGFIGSGTIKNRGYSAINWLDISINLLVLFFIIYIFVCLCSFVLRIVSQNSHLFKIIFFLALIDLPLLFVIFFGDKFFFIFYVGSFLFSILMFESGKVQRVILYSFIALIVIALISSFIIIFYISSKITTLSINKQSTSNMDFFILPCINEKILDSSEKQNWRLPEKYINEEWNVCYNPDCGKMCSIDNRCKGKSGFQIVPLRGDNPSCVCGCS